MPCLVWYCNNYSLESNGHNSKSVTYFVRIIYGVKVWFFILITLVQPRYTISIKVVVMRHHEKKLFLEFNRTIGTFHLLDFNFKKKDNTSLIIVRTAKQKHVLHFSTFSVNIIFSCSPKVNLDLMKMFTVLKKKQLTLPV